MILQVRSLESYMVTGIVYIIGTQSRAYDAFSVSVCGCSYLLGSLIYLVHLLRVTKTSTRSFTWLGGIGIPLTSLAPTHTSRPILASDSHTAYALVYAEHQLTYIPIYVWVSIYAIYR